MQDQGLPRESVDRLLASAASRDASYGDGTVLSSMCTDPHPAALDAHRRFVTANLGDPGLFPGTAELEREVVEMLGDILNLDDPAGYVTTGGNESNVQALRCFRDDAETEDPNVVAPESAHFSFRKAADLLGIELRSAPLDDRYRVDPEAAARLVDDDTVGIVAVAGTTETGQVDPVPALSEIALDRDVRLHVDAAFGGLLLPFLDDPPRFDFSLPGVDTVTVDPHKMGLSTLPAGGLLLRDPDLLDAIAVETPYLTSDTQHTLTGTRTGAGAASAYAAMKSLGRSGYRDVARRCVRNAHHLADRVRDTDAVHLPVEPATNLVPIAHRDPGDLSRRLETRGWITSVSTTPEALRIVVMPHLDRDTLDRFADDLEDLA